MLVSTTSVSAADELPNDLVVVIDDSHTPSHDDSYGNFTKALEDAESEINVNIDFEIGEDTNVLIIPASTTMYTSTKLEAIKDWFNEDNVARLLWVAGDSDYGGYFLQESTNAVLAEVESNLRMGAESISDTVSNDGASYRVIANDSQDNGDINAIITDGVDGCLFHGSTAILGYTTTVVDLRTTSIDGVEIIMKSSAHALAQDGDGSHTEFDFYEYTGATGAYPMMAIEDTGNYKYIIASGECIFSDYKQMYSDETEYGQNNGGEKLVNNALIWFGEILENADIRDDRVTASNPLLPFATNATVIGLLVAAVVIRRRN